MAKKGEPEKPVVSESESGEEEDEEASSEEAGSDESDSEPEQTQVAKKPSPPAPAALKKAQPQSSSRPQQQQPAKEPSSSSDEEESGSESESESEGPETSVKPIASKPMDDPPVASSGGRKARSKSSAADQVAPAKSAASKRPAEEKQTEVKDAKKSKKKPEIEGSEKKSSEDPKKLLFQRLWSEDDEIEILQGMIDYAAKKKSDPVADLSAFHDYIKKNLHVDVTRTQLQDKIRRLKKKYANNKSKEKEGKNRTFSKPHELKAYELSKKIWGNDGGKENEGERVMESPKANGGSVRKTPAKRAIVNENDEAKDAKIAKVSSGVKESLSPAPSLNSMGMSVEDRIMRMGAEFFEMGKGLEGEKEWKRLKVAELEMHLKQLEVRSAQTKLVLDVLKSEDH